MIDLTTPERRHANLIEWVRTAPYAMELNPYYLLRFWELGVAVLMSPLVAGLDLPQPRCCASCPLLRDVRSLRCGRGSF